MFLSSTALAKAEGRQPFNPPEAAQIERWSQENAWLRLLHFQTHRFGRAQSQVKDPDFFLAETGAQDPKAELLATLEQLLIALTAPEPLEEAADIRCTYPARVHFLKRRLEAFWPEVAWPEVACPALDAWQERLDAGRLSMIFPSGYMNDAASMFGHTLLRIDAKENSRRPDLVAWAVNFAAQVGEEDGALAYALKGLFGLYPGYFSLMPYYEKVNEYNRLENRDLWEYPLKLTPEGLQRVIWHLWELDQVRFDYWFFDQNCAYRLLALLSTAEDHLHLTQGFNIKALPVDTLRALKKAHLLDSAGHYRPAFATRLHHMSEQLTSEELAWARRLVFLQPDPLAEPLPETVNAAAVYEFAAEWLSFRFHHQGLPREEAAPQLHRLLVARAQTAQPAHLQPPKAPDTPPHEGHESARWGLGAGSHQGLYYLSVLARPAYHSRYDPLEGYLPNTEVNLFELEVRFHEKRQKIAPWRLTLIEVGNYLGSSPIFSLAAWRVQAEILRTDPLASSSEAWRSRLGGGYGRAWGSSEDWMTYAFWAAELEAGPQGARLGPGVHLGWLAEPLPKVRMGLDSRWVPRRFAASGEHSNHDLWFEATAQWNYQRNQGIQFQAQWTAREERRWEAGLRWLQFF